MSSLTRRDWLVSASATPILTAPGFAPTLSAQSVQQNGWPVPPLNHFPRMMQEYMVGLVRSAEKIADLRRNSLKSRADAEKYLAEVRKKIALSFGPMPEKTPLNAKITGKVERDAYTIENVIFESRPGFLVTANLYLPKNRKGPLPGVVGSCGHSANGKAADAYQGFAQGLARLGYICLIYDPIGQGERLQYTHIPEKQRPRTGVGEHLQAGNQQFLIGEFFGSWRAWDGIRALDYLLSRPEVDPKHVGITGNSGGGTMTTWLCGLESRWTMAAPGCFVTTFRRNCENELPADTEQCPPRAIALGLDHSDFLAVMAPKPVVILAKEKDFFDVRGSQEAYARLKKLYALLGAEDNIRLFVGPTAHGYTQEAREAMYEWFNRATKISDVSKEPELVIEKDETLYCTPKGQVADLRSRSVFSFTNDIAQKQVAARPKRTLPDLQQLVKTTLRLPRYEGVPDFRILRSMSGRKYPYPNFTPYAVETEPGIFSIVYRLAKERLDARPSKTGPRAILYVSHQSADAELREEALVTEIAKAEPESVLFSVDVRGIGESRPDTCGVNMYLSPYGSDYFYAVHSLMIDRPYPGQRTLDLLRVIDWLGDYGHKEIHLVAKGWGAIPATFAALLSPAVVQVTLKDALKSYQSIAETEEYTWPLSSFVPDVLSKFDLPECYEHLKAKRLRQVMS